MHVVQILLPVIADAPFGPLVCDLKQKLAERFGGVTIFSRSPAEGDWINHDGEHEADDVIIVEVVADALDRSYWTSLRQDLERELEQDTILIRAQEAIQL